MSLISTCSIKLSLRSRPNCCKVTWVRNILVKLSHVVSKKWKPFQRYQKSKKKILTPESYANLSCRVWTVCTVCRVCMVCSLNTVLSTIFHERQNEGLFFLLSKCCKVNVRISVYYHWKLQHRIKYNRAVKENDHRKLFSRILSRLLPCYFEIKSISPRALKT